MAHSFLSKARALIIKGNLTTDHDLNPHFWDPADVGKYSLSQTVKCFAKQETIQSEGMKFVVLYLSFMLNIHTYYHIFLSHPVLRGITSNYENFFAKIW